MDFGTLGVITELPFDYFSPPAIKSGSYGGGASNSGAGGRHQQHTVYGLLMHTSLAITSDGMLLALTDTKV